MSRIDIVPFSDEHVDCAAALLAARHERHRESEAHKSMITDWRMTNLLVSRFWPRRGFRKTFLRLYRSIP